MLWARPVDMTRILSPRSQDAVDHAHQRHHADIVVEPGIHDQRLHRRLRVALRRRDAGNDRLEQLRYALAGLGADAHGVLGVDADDLLDLGHDALGIGRRQVDLVDDRQHLEALLDRGVAIGDALRLDALGGIDHQQRALAGRQAARHLIREVDVARGVDQVELVALAVARLIVQRHALRLDGDAALALQVHRVEHLGLHLARLEAAAQLDQAVGERRFAVVNVRDDGEIAYALHLAAWKPRRRGARIIALSRAGSVAQRAQQLGRIEPAAAHRDRIEQQHRNLQSIAALQLADRSRRRAA